MAIDGQFSRSALAIPDVAPVGLTTFDAKDPDTAYPPIVPLRPPAGAPNVLVILIDDVGLGASSAFGGTFVRHRTSSGWRLVASSTRGSTPRREHFSPVGTLKLYVDDNVVGEQEIKTIASRFSLCGEGLCIGYDGGDAVSSEYEPKFEFTGGHVVKVVIDVAEDAYVDLERQLAAALARD